MGSNTTSTNNTNNTSSNNLINSNVSQVRTPYPGVIEPLQQLYGAATDVFNDPRVATGINNIYNTAANSYPYAQSAFFQAANKVDNPLSPWLARGAETIADLYGEHGPFASSIDAANQYSVPISMLYPIQSNLSPLAANTSGALTDTQQAILDQNAERLGNRLASQYSGAGRYGSFGAGIGLARGIAETNNPLIAQFNQANIGNALQANNLLGENAGRYGGLLGQQGQQRIAAGQARAQAAQLYNAAILGGQQQSQQWAQMLPMLYQMQVQPAIDMARYPWMNVEEGAKILGSTAPLVANSGTLIGNTNTATSGTGFSTGTGGTSQPTPWTSLAGLGIAGAGLLGNLGSLSDRRTKKNISLLGRDDETDLNIYSYNYKDDPEHAPKRVGPMAQEVAKKYPDAVGSVGGILYIKGDRNGLRVA